MPSPNTEDQLVEQPAIGLFAALGWATVCATDELLGRNGSPQLQRETRGEVVLVARLRNALTALNPTLPTDAIELALTELTRDRSVMLPTAANREVYQLLKEGVRITFEDRDNGGQRMERVQVFDWRNPAKNDFLLVSQMTITGPLYTCRPDLIGFVNGLPLVVLEFKKPSVPARQAFDENLTSYKHPLNGVPALFWYNAFLIASNGTESRIGSLTADWGRFFEWKRVESEQEQKRVSLETILRGTCDPRRLLDLVENFTLFSELESGMVKICGQNHQYLGVNHAITALQQARAQGHGRGGVFWQTQGSGKSFAMVFFARKILRTLPGNWTFVIVTDRVDLDNQIAKTFAACGAVTDAHASHASSGEHLKLLLGGNLRFVFTLIQKFQSSEVLCDRRDVIVLTDEAHRSQYDTLAVNMRAALPHATFIAFTGTPLIAGEERTREVFGDYVSIYDFQQSIEDGATVPLFYENRTPELRLENPTLNEDIYSIIEEAGLDEEAEWRLQKELGRQYHIITRDDRLETIAKDIVSHFLGRGFQGKAMVISIDKATALKMHDKVRHHWKLDLEKTEKALEKLQKGNAVPTAYEEMAVLEARLEILRATDMALIVSPAQNEIEQMAKLGLDIVPHRKRIMEEALDEKFKAPKNPLRIVFVCAMWLTGFDAPNCSTVYLDKPMRNHTLMQTIARANRVFPGKHSGLIVDYANVFASLEKALALYGTGKEGGGAPPVQGKEILVEELARAVEEAVAFCQMQGVAIDAIHQSSGLKRLELLSDAVDRFISPDPLRKEFLAHERLVAALYKAVKPDKRVMPFVGRCDSLALIADSIRARISPDILADISPVMQSINLLLDESIASDGFEIDEASPHAILDLSKIDFAVLAKRFAQTKRKNVEIERLKAAVLATLNRLIQINPTRIDFKQKFETLIEAYNTGSRNIDELFDALVALSKSLTEEQTRHVRESLSEEELAIFDILTRPDPALSPEETELVKKVVRQLYERLEALIILDWRRRSSARATVQETISATLDSGLPDAYTRQIYQKKCGLIFDYIYEHKSA